MVEESDNLAPPCTWMRRDVRCRWIEALFLLSVGAEEISNWYRIVSFRSVESFVNVGG